MIGWFSNLKFTPTSFPLFFSWLTYGAFTLDVKSMLNVNLDGILGGTQCQMGDSLMLSEDVKFNIKSS
jgi:hypothetical protein